MLTKLFRQTSLPEKKLPEEAMNENAALNAPPEKGTKPITRFGIWMEEDSAANIFDKELVSDRG